MIRLLRSARITRHHHYYKTVRPCAPHRYSPPHGFRRLEFSLFRPGGPSTSTHLNWPHYRNDRFPCSTPAPEPGSRPLHAGHRLGSKQVPPRLIPRQSSGLGSDVIQSISTRHRGFALARLPDPHLTRSRLAFSATLNTPALDRRTLRWFATTPCRAATEDLPPSLEQHRNSNHQLHPAAITLMAHEGRRFF
jgi:hypothetical protein